MSDDVTGSDADPFSPAPLPDDLGPPIDYQAERARRKAVSGDDAYWHCRCGVRYPFPQEACPSCGAPRRAPDGFDELHAFVLRVLRFHDVPRADTVTDDIMRVFRGIRAPIDDSALTAAELNRYSLGQAGRHYVGDAGHESESVGAVIRRTGEAARRVLIDRLAAEAVAADAAIDGEIGTIGVGVDRSDDSGEVQA